MQSVYRACCHVWNKDGTHQSFRGGAHVITEIYSVLGHKVSRATAYRYLEEEMRLWTAKDARAHLKRPDLAVLINSTRDADKEHELFTPSEEPMGRPGDFPHEWYPELTARCEKLQKLLGFGPHIVAAFATMI